MKESYKKVEQWLLGQQTKIDVEEDLQEKNELRKRFDHIQRNLSHYIHRKLNEGAEHFFCKECGEIEFTSWANGKTLVEHQLCHYCNFWREKEDQYLSEGFLIINGCTYSDAGATRGKDSHYNGFAGHTFNIRMLDGSREWSTNNLWCGGDIPKKYRLTTMKDNAEFVKTNNNPLN